MPLSSTKSTMKILRKFKSMTMKAEKPATQRSCTSWGRNYGFGCMHTVNFGPSLCRGCLMTLMKEEKALTQWR